MRRRYKFAAVGLLLLAIATLAAWIERQSIATYAIDRVLREHDVPARYRIVSVGPGVQRLADIRIGDPRRPDLVARQVDATIGWGLGGPRVVRLVAHGVRNLGRVVHGKLSLGTVDRLMPAPSGAPFALPDIAVDLDDVGIRLDMPAGAIGMTITGRGNLASGFSGRLAVVARQLSAADCVALRPTAWLAVTTADRSPHLAGPIRFTRLSCADRGIAIAGGALLPDATLAPALDGWHGESRVTLAQISGAGATVRGANGRVTFAGNASATRGAIELALSQPQRADWRAARVVTALRYAAGKDGWSGEGQIATEHAVVPQRLSGGWAQSLSATPLGPLAKAIEQGTSAAARDLSGPIGLAIWDRGGGYELSVARLDLASASGARLRLGGGRGVVLGSSGGLITLDGVFSLVGGGLPGIRGIFGRDGDGSITLTPFAANSLRLAMEPIMVAPPIAGARRVTTRLRFDGAIGGGSVHGLDVPIAMRIGPGSAITLDGGCTGIAFTRLDIVGARLGSSRLNLCATGPALFARDAEGRMTGGATIAAPRLAGSLSGEPLVIAAQMLRFSPADFALAGLDLRLAPETHLHIDRLGGQFAGLSGGYGGAAGNLNHVPLRLAAAQGGWRWAGGALALDGQATLSDAAAPARFNPLAVRKIDLRLSGGKIALTADLDEPKSGRKVSGLVLAHDLSSGKGEARLDVTALRFDKGFQPDTLTPLTLGVVADVRGAVSGEGRIRWTGAGVTSDGDFATDGVDLAAAFGNVSALKGKVHFDDLLALTTPPGQQVTIGQVNPGVPVDDGTIRFRLLPDRRVSIESGDWPFAGGTLALQPTALDFGRPSARRFTFHVEALDAAKFIQTLDLDNVAATGLFDGTLPMVFDDRGGRIEHGRLISRPGGGTLAYVGQVSQANLGSAGKLAFDALKSMRFNTLTINLDGDLDGEIVSEVAFAGVNQTPVELGGKSGLLPGMTNLPFRFNIKVKAPFRGLLNTAKSFGDVGDTVRNALPPVQPPASTAR